MRDRARKAEEAPTLHEITGTNQWGWRVQDSEQIRILQRFVWYTGAGLLAAAVAAIAIMIWTSGQMHKPLFITAHSLSLGLALLLLFRSVGRAKTKAWLQ